MGLFSRRKLNTKRIYSWSDVQRIVKAGEDEGFVFEQIEGKYFRAMPEEDARKDIDEIKEYNKNTKNEFFNRISGNNEYKNINPTRAINYKANSTAYDYDEER